MTKLQQRKIGQALKEERRSQGIDAEDVAEVLDCSTKHVLQVEKGTSAPSFTLFIRYCHALATEAHVILRDAGV